MTYKTTKTDCIGIALIPAYEPEPLLIDLLHELQETGFTSVVINDGSSSAYTEIFEQASQLSVVLTHEVNRGKGCALKTGLTYIGKHFEGNYAVVTLDADGQHQVYDALRACAAARNAPGTLILGSRNLDEDIPLRSRFGNTITRWIYSLTTGLHVHDTQTGLRAFGASLVPFLVSVSGERYEYEMNILLECAHRKIPIREIEIATIYINNNSASHFDFIKDSCRVYKEITKFSASSFIGFLVDYGAYILLTAITSGLGASVSLRISNIAARIISSYVNYTINRKLVFRSGQGALKSAAQYFALAAVILAANTFLLSFFVESLGMNRYAAKIAAEICFFIISWLTQRFLIFRKKERALGPENA